MKSALLFVYVWPEPYSSAAGVRTLQIAQHLQKLNFQVSLVSPCKENEASSYWRGLGFSTLSCPSNERFALANYAHMNPALVIYDRFVMEEQFGWQAREAWPQALHLVDTQDLHHIRRFREQRIKAGATIGEAKGMKNWQPDADFDRELSSLYRADASLVVSSWERDWLLARGYPQERVFSCPFAPQVETAKPKPRMERRDFLFLGNFRHAPNLDAVRWLWTFWPKIHAATGAKLNLIGAYPPQEISQLQKHASVQIKGNEKQIESYLSSALALFAPLRFGAGIKGKVLEAWSYGTPVVGTSIAFEGMASSPGKDSEEEWISEATKLFREPEYWQSASQQSWQSAQLFSFANNHCTWENIIELGERQKDQWRLHPVTRMLLFHQNQSYKYFSLWIEEKNKGK
jgi:glycosyltransferase involved in cell wall biosynthesis